MVITQNEKILLRELARQYAEIANLDIQKISINRMRATNDLKIVRPPVLIHEIPWHEMDIDGQLQLHCNHPFAKQMEWYFRSTLFQWKYFRGDMVVQPYYPIQKAFTDSGIGLDVNGSQIATDKNNNIVSHEYHDILATEDDLAKIKLPNFERQPEIDEQNITLAKDILQDILPIRLCGVEIYYSPWDQIPRYRGVEPIFMDMVDRPEFLHQIIQKFTEIGLHTINEYERLGLLDCDLPTLHCTPAYTSDLPAKDYTGGVVRLKDVWFRSMAQMFSSISPSMHQEFDLDYSSKLMEKCGLVYYGCCEPLDNKIGILKKIPNLRKVGVSPWANVESCAEQLEGNYVYARKPNPANVAIKTDSEEIRKEIITTINACQKHNCPVEFVLKDISTVSFNPYNLVVWEKTVREVLDEYYGV
ncbi:hypothetical protein RBG61_12690 [Paludicola sp. MB14-C6]|uniref:hypothetical protein n=1 Tax=Paludihabitans sp. MB14-C6 TaxID=3070656 RepID=UPI0027DD6068|nr:hypothetical protein [Paludicola sp. MB14-C6]WMJ22834.1 hypothetical protein RBG61_12690 [Paludicola sp. MB14-C6]